MNQDQASRSSGRGPVTALAVAVAHSPATSIRFTINGAVRSVRVPGQGRPRAAAGLTVPGRSRNRDSTGKRLGGWQGGRQGRW